jgi:hypothetical protein
MVVSGARALRCPVIPHAEDPLPDPAQPESIVLVGDLAGMASHEIGDEIWQETLEDAIASEAAAMVEHETAHPSSPLDRTRREAALAADMRAALQRIGDTYTAPDGVRYSLKASQHEARSDADDSSEPVVAEVVGFVSLPIGVVGSRLALVRWSDGTTSEALRWYDDEILVCEGDLIGKTATQLRSLVFRRDRDWLQGPGQD